MFKIHPARNTANGLFPFAVITQNRIAAGGIEIRDAERFNSLLTALEIKLFLDHVLNRDPVAIPTPAALDAISLHGPIAWNDIFDDGRQNTSVMRQPRGKWRTIVKHVR